MKNLIEKPESEEVPHLVKAISAAAFPGFNLHALKLDKYVKFKVKYLDKLDFLNVATIAKVYNQNVEMCASSGAIMVILSEKPQKEDSYEK